MNGGDKMRYGKRCKCGHNKNTHNDIHVSGVIMPQTTYTNCPFGCKGIVTKGTTENHTHSICGCKEYQPNQDVTPKQDISPD